MNGKIRIIIYTQEAGAHNVPHCFCLHIGIGCLTVMLTFFAMRPPQLAYLHIRLQIGGIDISEDIVMSFPHRNEPRIHCFFNIQPMSPYSKNIICDIFGKVGRP